MPANTQPAIAYVLLSGGIDSTTCVAEACSVHGRRNVRCVSIDYGQRHSRELLAAESIAKFYGRPHEVIKVSIPNTMLTNPDIEVPNVSYDDIVGVSPTYVPFRNGLFLATLASHVAGLHFDPSKETIEVPNAENEGTHFETNFDYNRNAVIYWGAHAEDAQNWAYPDCTPEFIGSMANALFIGTYFKLRLITPFQHWTKDSIVKYGDALKAPYYLSWSCYKGGETHCGTCSTCRARKEAFSRAKMEDPTVYLA